MPTITQGSCAFNGGVLCEKRRCWLCGWNPVITKNRKEVIRYNMPETIKLRHQREHWYIGSGEYPRRK